MTQHSVTGPGPSTGHDSAPHGIPDLAAHPPAEPFRIALTGDIDIQRRPELIREVERFRDSGRCTADVDLAEVSFLDSTGLQMFLRLRTVALERGGAVRLQSPNHRVRRILEVSGVTRLFVLEA